MLCGLTFLGPLVWRVYCCIASCFGILAPACQLWTYNGGLSFSKNWDEKTLYKHWQNVHAVWTFCTNHLMDYIKDVKKDPKSIYRYHLRHQVVFFATSEAFYFGGGLSTVCHGVNRVHIPLLGVLESQLMHHRGVEARADCRGQGSIKWSVSKRYLTWIALHILFSQVSNVQIYS